MNGVERLSIQHGVDCGCCEGLNVAVPAQVENRPGLPAIASRIGTHAEFKASLLARLSSSEALRGLRTRSDEDLSIALLDAWAMVADVLTFYSQYLANQSYVRTADERLSVRELARLIGYRPAPGVAATAYLAFTMDELPGSPARITLEPGTKVQSTPGPDETAQTFETVERIEARRAWNAMRPRLTKSQVLTKTTTAIRLQGIASSIQPGAAVVFQADDTEDPVFASVTKVEPDQLGQTTTLRITPLGSKPERAPEDLLPLSEVSPPLSGPAKEYENEGKTIDGHELEAEARMKGFEVADLFSALQAHPLPPQKILVFHQRTAIFGHNAPDWQTLPEALRGKVPVFKTNRLGRVVIDDTVPGFFSNDQNIWPGGDEGTLATLNTNTGKCPHKSFQPSRRIAPSFKADLGETSAPNLTPATMLTGGPFKEIEADTEQTLLILRSISMDKVVSNIFLDKVVSEIHPEQFVVLKQGAGWGIYSVNSTTELTKSCFMITSKITQLSVDSDGGFEHFKIRTTSAYVQSEWWPLAPEADLSSVPLRSARSAARPPSVQIGGLQILGTSPPQSIIASFTASRVLATGPTSPTPVKPTSIHRPTFLESNPHILELEGWVDGLRTGQRVVLTGQEEGGSESRVSEFLTIEKVTHDLTRGGRTTLTFTSAPIRHYVRHTVTLNANVALATHGETVQEVLGSGDATVPYQTFALRQPPITHVPADTASGALSTLEIRVNDIRWHEVPFLFGRVARDRVFSTHTTDRGDTVVHFGNGRTGSLLPTGQENVRAVYRRGIGLAGLVQAGQLNMLLSRPLGLQGVSNPLPSLGAEDPESLADTRQQAPMTVRTLDRIVSLQDYEDFARSYQGIAKAQARWVWDGQTQVICLTVAGPNGARIQEDSVQFDALLSSLKQAGDPFVRIVLKSYRRASFQISASVSVHEDYLEDLVMKEVEAALRAAFSFEAREFGQPAPASEVIAIMQAIPGVVAVDAASVTRTDARPRRKPASSLPAKVKKSPPGLGFSVFVAPRPPSVNEEGQLQAAELLTLDPKPLDLRRMP
jgi:hypothetical protein